MNLLPSDPVDQAKAIALAVVALLFVGLLVYLGWTKSILQTENTKLLSDNAALTFANQEWAKHSEETNRIIAKIKADSEARLKAAKDSLQRAASASEKDRASAATFASMKTTGDSCTQAKQLTDAYFWVVP